MKIKQIAIAVPDLCDARNLLEKLFGADFQVDDEMLMDGFFNGSHQENVDLSLSFDYKVLKDADELELIKSDNPYHWHRNDTGFVSHFGIYCDNEAELFHAVSTLKNEGFEIIQDSISNGHSRPNQDGSERRYRDVVFNTAFAIGFNIKLSLKV